MCITALLECRTFVNDKASESERDTFHGWGGRFLWVMRMLSKGEAKVLHES